MLLKLFIAIVVVA